MPGTENRARDRCQSQGRKAGGRKRGGHAGILHPDLNGNGITLSRRHFKNSPDQESQEITDYIVKNNDEDDHKAVRKKLCTVGIDHITHDQADTDAGDQGQDLLNFLRDIAEKPVQDQAERDRQNDDLNDLHKHAHGIHLNRLFGAHTGIQLHAGCAEKRRQKRRQNGRNRRHTHGQRNVTAGHESHDIGGGSSRTASHKNDADRQFRRQVEQSA